MGLFGNYEKAGVGIAKDAPKKKPFFRFWELLFRKFWKLIDINLLLMSAFLPLLGASMCIYFLAESHVDLCLALIVVCVLLFAMLFGPVTAGCTQVLRYFTMEKPVFLLNTFWKAFRGNFKKACLMGVIDVAVAGSVLTSFFAYPQAAQETGSNFFYVLFVITLSLGLAVLMMSFYAYPMIVSTDLSMKNILKNSLFLSCIALKTNLCTLAAVVVTLGVFAVLTMFFPMVMAVILPFAPVGFAAFAVVFNSYPVIQKYVINPFYAQKGEISPEMEYTQTGGENVFEDQGGREKPVAPKKKKGKGKVIS